LTARRVLDDAHAEALERLCDLFVPGSGRVDPVVYIDAHLAGLPAEVQGAAIASIDELAGATDEVSLAEHAATAAFGFIRALAIEAFYSDFVAPGADGPGAWTEIDFNSPLATRLAKDWSFMGIA
jgi:hypothetical protein